MLRNILAVIAGFLIGGVVNGALISLGPSLIPPPEGLDTTTVEGLRESIHLLEPRHFVMPFLAHALGTFVGALVAYFIATSRVTMAYVMGGLFLLGGIAAAVMIPAPVWFIALDLVAAYLPPAWLAAQIGKRLTPSR